MMARAAVLLLLSAFAGICADWNPKLAAEYLDARQKDWFVWPRANQGAKPCISCHTGVSYLLARPVLRKALGENAPTTYETGLMNSLRGRVEKQDPASPGIGVESVFAALFLESDQALDRMWAMQIKEGAAKGSWNWFSLNQDPWEMADSNYYGAALAAMATGCAPAEYRAKPAVRERVADLTAFLRSGQDAQTLHNRLMLLWASLMLPEVLPATERRAIAEAAWKQQQADGGWTMASLGPFKVHEKAPHQEGSNGYATAFTAYVLEQADGAGPRLAKALGWLRSHQDREGGYWAAESMNRQYEAGSMEEKFMRDAATAYASMALLGAGK